MAEVVYGLCVLMSIACATMLYRGYRASRTNLLFWSSLCFAGLAINNALMLLDLVVLPEVDLRVWRSGVATASLFMLVLGLVKESR